MSCGCEAIKCNKKLNIYLDDVFLYNEQDARYRIKVVSSEEKL